MLIRRKLCVKTALNLREKCAHVRIYNAYGRLNAGGSWIVASWIAEEELITTGKGWWFWRSYTTLKKAKAVALQIGGKVFYNSNCIHGKLELQ